MVARANYLVSAVAFGLLLCVAAPARATPPWNSRDELICRANSAVDYSYYWGGSCWCHNGCDHDWGCWAGSCSGSCPGCTHSGSYGADCSGLVNKVWQVPDPIATTTCGHGPYVANSFRSNTSYWSVISRSNLQRGDVLASSSHVVVYHYGDGWGSMVTYEAMGCSYGVVHGWRTCSSSYSAARRIRIDDCTCTVGATQTEGCGNCGTRSRTCAADCHWGSWSSCTGQGPCAPGASQTQDCGDCGTQSRTCTGSCQWGSWSACDGPDPGGGSQACDSGEPGPCAAGLMRCDAGYLDCEQIVDPVPELCDEVDNDCNGQVDDGNPTELGDPPPAYSSILIDYTHPALMHPGASTEAWASFENVGTRTWPRGELWLSATRAREGEPSRLYAPGQWPAYDIVAISDADVAPGDVAFFRFTLQIPEDAAGVIEEELRLLDPTGEPLGCPSPSVVISILVPGGELSQTAEEPEEPPVAPSVPASSGGGESANLFTSGCACSSGGPPLPAGLLWLPLLIVLFMRRRLGR